MEKFSPDQEPPEVSTGGKVKRWVFVAGNLELIRYEYEAGTRFPEHSHPEEQVTVVIEGGITFHFPDRDVTLGAGDMLHIPGDTPHSATSAISGKTVTINVFHPPRKVRP